MTYMGAVHYVLNESERCFLELGGMYPLTLEDTRSFQASPLRYCLKGDVLFLPKGISLDDISFSHRLSWARIRVDTLYDLSFEFSPNEPLPSEVTFESLEDEGFGLGSRYVRRHRE